MAKKYNDPELELTQKILRMLKTAGQEDPNAPIRILEILNHRFHMPKIIDLGTFNPGAVAKLETK
jgi:hypothetical protein